jgi:hypothetical protein
MTSGQTTESLSPPVFGPLPERWRAMMAARSTDAKALRFREQLGIDPDRPIVMSGHQAGVWHPGIAAKWFACVAAARAFDAVPVWLVVDQDDNDPTQVSYPTVTPAGDLARETWSLSAAGVTPGVSNARRGAVDPDSVTSAVSRGETETRAAAPGVEDGLELIHARVQAHADAASLAAQFAHACADMLDTLCPVSAAGPSPTLIYASQMGRTDVFGEILSALRADPGACIRAYNEAAQNHPSAGVRSLHLDEASGRIELPVWQLADASRTPVYADGPNVKDDLAPRALMMTALVRTFACELFIHGTGGAGIEGDSGYENVTHQWWRTWQGDPPRAPSVMTTATRTLAITGNPPTVREVEEARAKAHKSRHDPALVGDAEAAKAKRDLLASIAQMKERGENPATLFRQMQDLLTDYRQRRAADIAQLEADAARLEQRLGDAQIAHDRTWAFPLYEPHQLTSLRDQVFAAFGLN